ncbi:DNA replication protein DnaD (DnaD) [Fructobacillus fructosus]|uniref:DNA replication protein DnaD (DnaD) n=1 Tax=Fructobacillus fructosus TaxID=1631 RepID=A0ABM9MZE0_9LACO|nr:DNA replication protein DnaD (DnaD) [Fructobacillus fructosus]
MAKNKKYFWIKLKPDFFNDPYIKMLRRMAGGDTYTIIYLEMLVKSTHTDGMIYFQGAGVDIAEELSLMLNENVEDVRALLAYLEAKKLITHPELQEDLFLVATPDLTGSETDSAERVRKFRKRQDQKALQSNTDVTIGNDKKELEKEIEIDKDTPKPPEGDSKKSRKSSAITKQEEKDFEALWKLYPCKEGKTPAKRAYVKAVRDGVTNKTIQDGIVAYAKKVSAENTEKKYMKNGDTFFRNRVWEDDLTPSVTTGRNGKPGKQEPPLARNEVPASSESVDMQSVKDMLKGYKTSG